MKTAMTLTTLFISLITAQDKPDSLLSVTPDSSKANAEVQTEAPADAAPTADPPAKAETPTTEATAQPARPKEEAAAKSMVFKPQVQQQEHSQTELIFPQNPRLAAFLSVTLPGLGQIYQGNYWKAAFFLGTFAAAGSVIGYYGNKKVVDKEIEYRDGDDNLRKLTFYRNAEFEDFTTTEQVVNSCAFAVVAASYIWSVIDAYISAKAFNRKHFIPTPQKTSKIGIMPIAGEGNLGVAALHRF